MAKQRKLASKERNVERPPSTRLSRTVASAQCPILLVNNRAIRTNLITIIYDYSTVGHF
jgi:hypothetical protein